MQSPETWDAVAVGYAEQARRHALRFAEEAIARMPPRPGDHVLDIASGPGVLAFLAAPRAARVVGVDFAPRMIDELRGRAMTESVRNVEGTVMDSRSLDFPDASFDRAYCMFGFMFFPDRAACFREILRVLRPGGRVLIGTWGPIDRRPLLKLGFDGLADALPSLPPPQKGDLQSPAECVAEMSAAGFTDVEAVPFTASARVESAEQYLHFLERGGAPFVALRKKLGEDTWAAAHQRMLEALRRRIPEGGMDLGAEAIFTSGNPTRENVTGGLLAADRLPARATRYSTWRPFFSASTSRAARSTCRCWELRFADADRPLLAQKRKALGRNLL